MLLTKTEKRIYEYIHSYWLRHLQSPTISEIAIGVKINSKGTVHRYVNAIIEKGLLKRDESGWRNIQIATPPDMTLPLLGTIAAGKPIEAIAGVDVLNIADKFFGEDKFALKVSGDSMINIGIVDSDWVVIRRQYTADNGNIVVAIIDEEQATLKRFYKKNNSVELRSENDSIKTMVYSPDRVSIQGVLIHAIKDFN